MQNYHLENSEWFTDSFLFSIHIFTNFFSCHIEAVRVRYLQTNEVVEMSFFFFFILILAMKIMYRNSPGFNFLESNCWLLVIKDLKRGEFSLPMDDKIE